MENHFEIQMTEDQLRGISSIGLAHMGDAVFELLVRGWLCAHGKATGKGLHQATIQLVRAEKQAEYAEKILPLLTEEETARLRVHPLIWGCDFCQRACPYNAAPAHSPLPEFSTSLVDALENSDLEGLTNRTFRDKYGDRAFAWRGPGPLRRNLGLKEE